MAYCVSFMLMFFSIAENIMVWIQLSLGYLITVSMVILLPELEISDFLKILKVTDGLNYLYTIFSMFLISRSGFSSLVESMLICTSLRTSSYEKVLLKILDPVKNLSRTTKLSKEVIQMWSLRTF